MQTESGIHSAEDLLEEYAFGRLSEKEAIGIEDHLFVCEHCQVCLIEIEAYLQAMKTATLELRHNEKISKSRSWVFLSGGWWQIPKPGWTIGFALTVCLLISFRPQSEPSTQTEVRLIASRGTSSMARVSSKSKIVLRIDAGQLVSRPSYQIEVVDSDGSQVWKTQAAPSTGQLTALVPSGLAAGTYWVRVYGESDRSNQLQEYQLDIR